MKILLVAATAGEVEPVFKHLGGIELPKAGALPLSLQHGKLEVDFVISGIGMVPTVYATTRALASRTYDLALNAGIGGGRQDITGVTPGCIVQVDAETFPETGAEDGLLKHLSLTAMNLPGENEFPFEAGVLRNNRIPECISKLGLRNVTAQTVNLVTGSTETQTLRESRNDDVTVESMEGGGFFYACLKENVPFAELRAISNFIGPRNRESWKIPEAIAALNKTLIQLFDQLSR